MEHPDYLAREPNWHEEQIIEIKAVNRIKIGCFHPADDWRQTITSEMMRYLVLQSPQALKRRHRDQHPTAGLQYTGNLAQGQRVISDMLEDIGSQHEFKTRVFEGKRTHIAAMHFSEPLFSTKSYRFIT